MARRHSGAHADTRAEWPDAHLLVVDDEEPIRTILAEVLRIHGYDNVDTYSDGVLAMQAYDRLVPDLVLLDLHMPGLDGVGVLEQLAARPPEQRAPVIVMTGAGQREYARRTLALGAADFLSKPIDSVELLLRVRHQLRERRLRRELALHSRDLEALVEQRAGELTVLSRVLDDMPLPALVLTDDLDLHYANARGDDLLAAAGGRVLEAFAPAEGSYGDLAAVLRGLGDEPRTMQASVIAGPGGAHRRVELAAKRVGPDLVTVVVHDVEERELTRDTLQRALAHEMETAQRMRTLEEMRTRFLSAVSHELRTPLTIILGAAESLQQHDERLGTEQRHSLLGQLHRNAGRLQRLLDDLLDLNRLAAGRLSVQPERHDVAQLVRTVVDEVELDGHELTTDLRSSVAVVEARLIRRAVANLVQNAVVHTAPRTPIEVAVRHHEGLVRISVTDRGAGVPDELKGRIFDAFEQGPTAPRHQPGTGIGLSLAREFVELHGGTVRVDDTPHGGATFVIELPVDADHLGADDGAP